MTYGKGFVDSRKTKKLLNFVEKTANFFQDFFIEHSGKAVRLQIRSFFPTIRNPISSFSATFPFRRQSGSKMRIALVLILIFLANPASANDEKQDRALIEKLNSPRMNHRDDAEREILRRGDIMLKALKLATTDDSPEIRRRARRIYRRMTSIEIIPVYDAKEFNSRLDGKVNVVNFDDVETSVDDAVKFAPDRYAKSLGLSIASRGGEQFAGRTYNFPTDFVASSGPNSYAAGPRAEQTASKNSGGHETDFRFSVDGERASTSGFGAIFIDADHPDVGTCEMKVFDFSDRLLKTVGPITTAHGARKFVGVIARNYRGEVVPAIGAIYIKTGCSWVEVDAGEGVTLDDITFARPAKIK
ncbi:hypothetical protein N9242_03030 [Vicingaceae bacterium]|nr:hypothetical protein [Vicingaceae bacterium]